MEHFNEAFLYGTLKRQQNEIRLISIQPESSVSKSLQLTLYTVELWNAPPFDALSYVWGNQDAPVAVAMNGHDVSVTPNLYAALLSLRPRIDCNRVWIDALCIDQNNDKEKSWQVPLMRYIYGRASRVWSWLGNGTARTGLAFDLLERWAAAILSTSPDLRRWPNREPIRKAIACIEDPFQREAWIALAELFRNPYWQRIWIVQEVSLARRCMIVCGGCEIAFDKILWTYRTWLMGDLQMPKVVEMFRDIIKIESRVDLFWPFMNIVLEVDIAFQANKDAAATEKRGGQEPHRLSAFAVILKRASRLLASDARDKVYGMLGLVTAESISINTDYSLTTDVAYINATKDIIKVTKRLDVLSFAGRGYTCDSRASQEFVLPSWVPNFRDEDLFMRFCDHSEFFNTFFYHAASNTVPEVLEGKTRTSIFVKGIVYDEVASLASSSLDSDERYLQWVAFFLLHVDSMEGKCRRCTLQSFFHTTHIDHYWQGQSTPDFLAPHLRTEYIGGALQCLSGLRALENKLLFSNDTKTILSLDSDKLCRLESCLSETASPYMEDNPWFAALCQHREHKDLQPAVDNKILSYDPGFDRTASSNLYVTRAGYLGVGPKTVRPGDRLLFASGCSVPLLIRYVDGKFLVISDTYVSGLMQGEIITQYQSAGNAVSMVELA